MAEFQVSSNNGTTAIIETATPSSFVVDGTLRGPAGPAASVVTDSIWDAKGDLAVGTGANTASRLAVGTNGQVLTADSAEATGLKWAAAGAGDVTAASNFGTDNVLIRSDGTSKGVQSTGISVADTTNDVSGVGTISSGAITSTGASSLGSLTLNTDLAVTEGGTGASTAANARTNLGVGTGDSPQFTAINLGHASDTTLTRTGAGSIAVEGNAIYRAGGTDVPITDGGTGASTAADALTNLGLTATAAELNTLDGITATVTELNYTDGVTSAIQTQLDAKAVDSAVVHNTGNETVAGIKTFSSDPIIPDEAYGAGWNGSLEPPTKNAVYDKIETVTGGGSSGADYVTNFALMGA